MIDAIKRLIDPLKRKIQLTVSRCVLRLVNDALSVQGVQITFLGGEVRSARRVQEYGFSSNPLEGAEGIALAVGGDSGNLVVVATDDARYRPTGEESGTVTVYNHTGSRIRLLPSGEIEILPSSGTVRVVGNLVATGNVSDLAGSMMAIRLAYNSDVHGALNTPHVPIPVVPE